MAYLFPIQDLPYETVVILCEAHNVKSHLSELLPFVLNVVWDITTYTRFISAWENICLLLNISCQQVNRCLTGELLTLQFSEKYWAYSIRQSNNKCFHGFRGAGELIVSVIQCRGLEPDQVTRTLDSYVKIWLTPGHPNKQTTKVSIYGNSNRKFLCMNCIHL